MEIQWYPGHMKKTFQTLKSDLKLVDVVIRLLDARIPRSSNNPLLEEMLVNKCNIIVLNKSDISDSNINQEWVSYYQHNGLNAVLTDSVNGTGFQKIKVILKEAVESRAQAEAIKGRLPRPIRAMVVGITNVGKSAFINRITGSSAAIAGERPGLTRGRQWIRLNPEFEIMDTPGVLWPDLKVGNAGMNLALTGAINDNRFDITDAILYLIQTIEDSYPGNFINRYKIKNSYDKENIIKLLEEAGRNRGCIISGGVVDINRISIVILDEFRGGKLGRITLERP